MDTYSKNQGMTQKRRDLMMRVLGTDNPAMANPTIMVFLQHFDGVISEPGCDAILEWFVRENIVGPKFIGWVFENKMTPQKAILLVRKRLRRDNQVKALYYGRDYRV